MGLYPANEDTRRFVRRFLGVEKTLESRFPKEQRCELLARFPAHLHVNVDSAFRGARVGKRLMELYFSDLKKAGAPGVRHVCGSRPVGFYEKLGFKTLAEVEKLFVMGRAL
jgi:GNAT superfamily N-acetyltransferase